MPIANINSVNHADFIPEIWLNEALGYLREKLYLVNRVTKDTELNGAFDVGDILNVPKRGSLTANKKTEAGAIVLQQPAGDKVQVQLDQHYHVAFSLSDFIANMSVSDAEGGYVADSLGVLAEKVETSIMALYPLFTNEAGVFGTDIDEDTILEARQTMNENKCPKQGRTLVVSAKDETTLLKIDRFTRADAYGKNGIIAEGSIGRAHGFDIFQSNLLPVVAGTPDETHNETHNIAFHKNGIILASRPLKPIRGAISTQVQDPESGLILRLTIGYNSTYNTDQVVLDALWGTAVMHDEFVVDVKS